MKNSSFLVVFEQIAKASAFEKYRILNKFTNFLSNGSSFNSQPISWLRLVVVLCLRFASSCSSHAYFYKPETRAHASWEAGGRWKARTGSGGRRARRGKACSEATKRSRPNVWRRVRTAESEAFEGFVPGYET